MIILTGGAGFIGSAMLWELNRHGIDDVLIVDDLENASSGKWKNLAGLRFSDIIGIDDFPGMLAGNNASGISGIIHMGAISATTEQNADLLLQRNYHYSRTIGSYCAEHGIRLIYASSAATYGDGQKGYLDNEDDLCSLRPLNMYGYSKQLFDLWASRTGLLSMAAGLKFFNVYGPNEYHKGDMKSVVCKAFRQISDGGRVELFASHRKDYPDGGQKRDFVYIKDCTSIMYWLLENPSVAGLFNVGTGHARTFADLAEATFAAMEKTAVIDFIPMPEPLRGKYQYFTEADMNKLRAFGYTLPLTPLEEGVSDYVCNYLMKEEAYLEHNC
ncbi:MAG: ADP-glyceromanno-heptose 6-epimerase [Prosthecochloris sp.]|nr:ADP-glyceromanno-heptose 6-epimerase [Prosthecochloris sp.]